MPAVTSISNSRFTSTHAKLANTIAERNVENTGKHPTRTSKQQVLDLLHNFSDVAYNSEEEDLPWESWNYHRMSTF